MVIRLSVETGSSIPDRSFRDKPGSDSYTDIRPSRPEFDGGSVWEFEEHSDLLHGMLEGAVQDCRRRAKAVRAQLKATMRGPELRRALAAAKASAKAELTATKASIIRNFALLRASRRRKRRGSSLIPVR